MYEKIFFDEKSSGHTRAPTLTISNNPSVAMSAAKKVVVVGSGPSGKKVLNLTVYHCDLITMRSLPHHVRPPQAEWWSSN